MSTKARVPREKQSDATDVIAEDADRYSALYALSTSEGGVLLIAGLKQEIVSCVDKLANGYKTIPEIELRALCASLDTKRSLVQSLTRSKDNLDGALAALDELIA